MPSSPPRAFTTLVHIVSMLRGPTGCPWDRDQTLQSLSHFVLEEAYEVVDAIERGDVEALREEIGDHIFEGVFLAQIAAETGTFDIDDSLNAICDKLVRRHPHVFQADGRLHDLESRERAPTAEAALARWDAQKAAERANAGRADGALSGLPKGLPSLLRAYKLGKRAAGAGFDWPRADDVLAKIDEEVAELRETVTARAADPARVEEEMGDLLLAIANLSRKLGVDPEAALRKANDKFTSRFNAMEERIRQSGVDPRSLSLVELEAEWQRVKIESGPADSRTRNLRQE